MIYNGVLESSDIYDETTAGDLRSILFFGDDMQGCCLGFDLDNGCQIFEIDPADMSCRKVFNDFSGFIRDKLQEF